MTQMRIRGSRALEDAVEVPQRVLFLVRRRWASDRATRPDCLSGHGLYPLSNRAWRDRVASKSAHLARPVAWLPPADGESAAVASPCLMSSTARAPLLWVPDV